MVVRQRGVWWEQAGRAAYPRATRLLVLGDGGGSNSASRTCAKKTARAGHRLGLEIRVATIRHTVPSTIDRTPVFPHITCACQGVIFHTMDIAQQCSARTKTTTGLRVTVRNMHIAPYGRTLQPQTRYQGQIVARLRHTYAFDHFRLVINHPIGWMPDTPQPHLTLTVRTDQRVPSRALLVPLPVGQAGNDLHRILTTPAPWPGPLDRRFTLVNVFVACTP